MANIEDFYRRWTNYFWERFADLTGWDPAPELQLKILGSAFAAIFLGFVLLYVRRIMKKSGRAAKRDQMVADYQKLRRYQTADDR